MVKNAPAVEIVNPARANKGGWRDGTRMATNRYGT
jgi:hypothetical protein